MAELNDRWYTCTDCRLHSTRCNVVVGIGPMPASLLLVSEAPGEAEDSMGVPFSGRGGELLWKAAKELNIPLNECYLTYLTACRTPTNRIPMPDEVEACAPRLAEIIEKVQPQAMLLMGAQTLTAMTGNLGISKHRGKPLRVRRGPDLSVPAIATWHPSSLIGGGIDRMEEFKQDLWAAWELTIPF